MNVAISDIAVQVIRETIEGWRLPYDNLNDHDLDVLAQRIDEALFDPLWRERQIMSMHWNDADAAIECRCGRQFGGDESLRDLLKTWLVHFTSTDCP